MHVFIRKNQKNLLFYMGLFIITVVYLSNFGIDIKTDDGWFMTVSKERSLVEFILWRYHSWSARIFPEVMLYLIFLIPLFFHHLISAGAWLLYSYSLVRLFNEKVGRKNFLVAFLSLGFINAWVMKDSIFWITGAINYLWPLSLGLFALIPYADNFFRRKKTPIWQFLLPALIFSFSNEQLIICVIGVVLMYHLVILIQKRNENYGLFVLTAFFIFGFVFMFLAPGNSIRLQQEIEMWMPDFNKLSVFSRVLRGTSWLFEGFQTKLLLLFLAILVIAVFIDTSKLLAKVTSSYTIFLLLFMYNFSEKVTNFQLINTNEVLILLKQGRFFNQLVLDAMLPYMLWGAFFTLVVALSIVVSEQKIFVGLNYCAALFSAMLLWFSPTMYASGARVFMCASIFLLMIVYLLYQQALVHKTQNEKKRLLFYMCFVPGINLFFALLLA